MSRSLKTRPWRPKTTPRRSFKSERSKSFNSSRASDCFEKSVAESFLNASSSCAAESVEASKTMASAANPRLSLSCVFDIGERSFPCVRWGCLLLLAKWNHSRRGDEARDAVGDCLGHAPLARFRLDEVRVLLVAEHDHLDCDDRHLGEDRAGERAALLAPDLCLHVRAHAVVVERVVETFGQRCVDCLSRASAAFDYVFGRPRSAVFRAPTPIWVVDGVAALLAR